MRQPRQAALADPRIAYVGTNGGVFKTTDGAATWAATGLSQQSPLASVELAPLSAVGGARIAGTVTLASPAPAGGAQVALSVIPAENGTVPTTVTVPEGTTSASFTLTTRPVAEPSYVDVDAVLGDAARHAGVRLYEPPHVDLYVPPGIAGGTPASGVVSILFTPSPDPVTVALSSSNPAVLSIPASILVTAGAGGFGFDITTSAVLTSTPVTIRATAAGTTTSTVVTVTPVPSANVSLVVDPTSKPGGGGGAFWSHATVTLNGAATGNPPVMIGYTYSDSASFNQTQVPPGQMSFTFPTGAVPHVPGTSTVTLTASFNGTSKSSTLTVTNRPPIGAVESVHNAAGSSVVRRGDAVVARGWAGDWDDGNLPATVKVTVDGKFVGTVPAWDDRPDLPPAHDDYFGFSGWSLSIATAALSIGTHIVTAVATDSVGEAVALPGPITFSVTR